MRLIRLTAPPELPITLVQVKAQLRIEASDEDTLLNDMIAGAVAELDGAAGILNRALVYQQWQMNLDAFPDDDSAIVVPLPPFRSLASFTYVDSNGATQTVASSVYQIVEGGDTRPAEIALAYNQTWPTARTQREAVTLTFWCGYAPDESGSPTDFVANVPGDIKRALLLTVGYWFENRSDWGAMPKGATAMLEKHRVHTFA